MSVGSDYEDAVRSGNTPLANYLAQALAANAGININANQVTAAPASMLNPATPMYSGNSVSMGIPKGFFDPGQPDTSNTKDLTFGSGLGALVQGFTHPFDTFFGNQSEQNAAAASKGAAVDSVTGGVTGLLKIVTDVPRMVTIFIGLVLLIAGLFMLGNRTIIQAVQAVKA